MTGVFNPRAHRWEEHFEIAEGFLILGRTSIGRASVELLRMNRPVAVEIRQWVAQQSFSR
jgi:hypothetical protein